ncbi:hypothetical protein QR680_001715 [Steinernema hermaphroditum]|uniref:Uncharacterized protein n=1 Tax=Steinernema hermaphroditum TaxID=289476 RepID=A0AA39LGM9_9BILA|nr:hypothetical protein QR680_001715 [Steinernema hermaphroditum]
MKAFIFVLLLFTFTLSAPSVSALPYDRDLYELLVNDLEQNVVDQQLIDRLERRARRASEKKSYPRMCYFSPIQCLFTRN